MSRQISIADDLYDEILSKKPEKMSFSVYIKKLHEAGDPLLNMINDAYAKISLVVGSRGDAAAESMKPLRLIIIKALQTQVYIDSDYDQLRDELLQVIRNMQQREQERIEARMKVTNKIFDSGMEHFGGPREGPTYGE